MPDGSGKLLAVDEPSGRWEALGLTEMQAAFVRFFVINGGNSTEAARLAGYANPGPAGFSLKNTRHVAAAIARAIGREMVADGSRLAWGVIKQALERDDVRFSDRLKAAFKVVDFAQAWLARERPDGEKRPEDMNADELRAVLEESQKALGSLIDGAKPVGSSKAEQAVAGGGSPCAENGAPLRTARTGATGRKARRSGAASGEAGEAKASEADGADGAE